MHYRVLIEISQTLITEFNVLLTVPRIVDNRVEAEVGISEISKFQFN